jgi:hypothetical protein
MEFIDHTKVPQKRATLPVPSVDDYKTVIIQSIAAQAMQGLLANGQNYRGVASKTIVRELVLDAFAFAEALYEEGQRRRER